ncbi:hypothetical protein YN1_1440 [Nanoarchaeota archaeon]
MLFKIIYLIILYELIKNNKLENKDLEYYKNCIEIADRNY